MPLKSISTKGVKIFRPAEWELLLETVSPVRKVQLQGLLFTGMRYVEAVRFQQNPDWWDGRSYIALPEGAAKKEKAEFSQRTIKLSKLGSDTLPLFLKEENRLPDRNTWDWIIKDACEKAGIEFRGPRTKKIAEERIITRTPDGKIAKDPETKKRMIQRVGERLIPAWSVNAKSTRKTWESWLAMVYGGNNLQLIQLYQGHNATTQSKHYLGLGFYPEDTEAMKKYVEGWL